MGYAEPRGGQGEKEIEREGQWNLEEDSPKQWTSFQVPKDECHQLSCQSPFTCYFLAEKPLVFTVET